MVRFMQGSTSRRAARISGRPNGIRETDRQAAGVATAAAQPAAAAAPWSDQERLRERGRPLTGKDGMTPCSFKKDSPNASVCMGAFATNWPPLTLAPGDSTTSGTGVTGSLTTCTRTDGTMQVAYVGAPVHCFAADTKAGDTNGQDVNDVWSVAQPQDSSSLAGCPLRRPRPASATDRVRPIRSVLNGRLDRVAGPSTSPGRFVSACRLRSTSGLPGERCRLPFGRRSRKHMRFASTNHVGVWRNGGARALGARGCGFESHRPDHPEHGRSPRSTSDRGLRVLRRIGSGSRAAPRDRSWLVHGVELAG